jgi:DNA-binding NarL/FixJ family response regulator
VRVVLAEDEGLLREGLARLLADAGFEVIGKAGDAAGLMRLVDARLPDVVLTDIRMPPGHSDEGLVAAEQIRDRHPQIGVLVLSHHVDSRYAMRLLGSYPQRSGYLLKERVSEVAVLSDALRRIGEGECVIDPTIVSRLMSRDENGGALAELTDREREVLSRKTSLTKT